MDSSAFIGKVIGNVHLLKELGHGNKGIVFIGFQTSLKRQVAVKILPKALIHTEHDAEVFRTEAEIVAGLSHQNIIPIYEMGETDEFFYHVIQLINGSDLNHLIKKRYNHPLPSKRILTLSEIFSIMVQILDALDYAHNEGVIHRDIKPSNILVEEQRQCRSFLADFGIAHSAMLVDQKAHEGIIVGSPVYIAPEQARGEAIDERADIYSMGMTMLKMVVGDIPRRRESPEHIIHRKAKFPDSFLIKSLGEIVPKCYGELCPIIEKSIATAKEQRYHSAGEFREALMYLRQTHPHYFQSTQ